MTSLEEDLQAFSAEAFRRAVERLRTHEGFLGTGTMAHLWRNALRWRRFFRPSSFYGHRIAANVAIVRQYGGQKDVFVTDSCGICKNAVDGEDCRERLRKASDQGHAVIAFFGGSTMQGVGAGLPEFTIPAQVERILLEKHGISSVCLNHGTAGWCCAEELHLLLHETGYGPDVCIFYDGFNCCWNFYYGFLLNSLGTPGTPSWEKGTAIRHSEHDTLNAMRFQPAALAGRVVKLCANRMLGWIATAVGSSRWESFWDRLAGRLFPLGPPNVLRHADDVPISDARRDELLQAAAAEYLRIDALAAAVCAARGIRFRHFFQPSLATSHKPLTAGEQAIPARRQRMRNPEIFALFPQIIRKAGWPGHLVDLTSALDGVAGDAFLDRCHLNRHGNYHVARHIVSDLLADGLLGNRS
jgi:hypothetical protein